MVKRKSSELLILSDDLRSEPTTQTKPTPAHWSMPSNDASLTNNLLAIDLFAGAGIGSIDKNNIGCKTILIIMHMRIKLCLNLD